MSQPATHGFNHLINEKSPYLQQHAHNPVDWYPWGEEAFKEARKRDVPIFLSIGYSTCHWCHVMEHESFEDEETAEALNKSFVCVKVDREERPDIDSIYMKVCQMMTGSGGWPLTIIMTSEKEPFYAGTYLPKKSRHGMLGLNELIKRVNELWRRDRYRLVSEGASILETLSQPSLGAIGTKLGIETLHNAYDQLSSIYDEDYGGFGRAPKFPSPHNLMFLLRYWKRTREPHALKMVSHTLESMMKGGIHDHIGGGFHRYSTDSKWLIPHFEKMLYDQATLLISYTEAYQVTKNQAYANTARDIADYTLRRLTSPEGGFYSAEDADSEGEEGRYYTWTLKEMKDLLGEEAALAVSIYGVTEAGNFKEQPEANILTNTKPQEEILKEFNLQKDEYLEKIRSIRNRLNEAREKRIPPLLDEKIMVDWNGLMIAALSKAGAILGDESYVEAAEDAARFIQSRMKNGTLLHRYRLGEASIPGFSEDYSYLAWGLVELYEATFKTEYLEHAKTLVEEAIEGFWDADQGGFYLGRSSDEGLPRLKDTYDGAKPSGNSVMAMNLIRLSKIFGGSFEETAEKQLGVISSEVDANPLAHIYFLCALDYLTGPNYEVVIAGDSREESMAIIKTIQRSYLPNKTLMLKTPGLQNLLQYTSAMREIDGKTAIYICRNQTCGLPTADVYEAIKSLEK